MKTNKPNNIKLTQEIVCDLKANIASNSLDNKNKEILTGLIESNLWLQSKLLNSSITIAQLKKLFGVNISTEKKSLKLLKEQMLNHLLQQLN